MINIIGSLFHDHKDGKISHQQYGPNVALLRKLCLDIMMQGATAALKVFIPSVQ